MLFIIARLLTTRTALVFYPDVTFSTSNPKTALHTYHHLSFERESSDPQDDVPISAWEADLNDKSCPWGGIVAAAADKEAPSKVEYRHIRIRRSVDGGVTEREVKSAIKQLVRIEMVTIVEEALGEALRRTVYKAQSGVRSVVYTVIQHVILDLLRKRVIEKNLDTHIAKYSYKDAAAEGWSERLLTSSSIMASNVTFVKRGTYTTIENKKYSVIYASQNLMDTAGPSNDGSESLPSRSDSGTEKPLRNKLLKRRSIVVTTSEKARM